MDQGRTSAASSDSGASQSFGRAARGLGSMQFSYQIRKERRLVCAI